MKTQRQPITNEQLLKMLSKEIEEKGNGNWSQRRHTIVEMLRMRGVKF